MKRFIFLLFFITSYLFSYSMYYEYCISDYYFKNGYFYYKKVGDDDYKKTSSFYKYRFFNGGFDFNDSNDECYPKPILKSLELSNSDYNFLMAFSGLLVGFSFLNSLLLVFKRK